MKFTAAPLACLFLMPPTQGFAMMNKIAPAVEFPNPALVFPNRFREYLKDVGEIMEKDWTSTFLEDDLETISRTFSKGTFDLGTFHRASPSYEINDSPENFEIKIDVPDFSPQEISIDLKAGGRILSVRGNHEEEEKGQTMKSKFQLTFTLDPSIKTNELIADLKDKKLTITAPREVDLLQESRKIEMTINGKKVQGKKA